MTATLPAPALRRSSDTHAGQAATPQDALERRSFHVLDGLRGVAAILVLPRHTDKLFGGLGSTESYLAVDLFFVMSAVVIANAYDRRLQVRGNTIRFIGVRFVRLWPLYLTGLMLGAVAYALQAGAATPGHGLIAILRAAPLALLMLPSSPVLDGPRWSLTFEMAINIVYAVTARFLKTWVLALVCAISGLLLAIAALHASTLDLGWRQTDWVIGLWRVTYSFSAGLLVQRFMPQERRHAPWSSLFLIAGVAVLLESSPADAGVRAVFDLSMVIIFFPLIVGMSMVIEVGPRLASLYGFLGITSYAVYVLHQPGALLFEGVLRHLGGLEAAAIAPMGGFFFVGLLLTATYLLDRFFDYPLRKVVSQRLNLRAWKS